MTLLDQARAFDSRYGRIHREATPPRYQREHYELAAAFLKGEISSTAFRSAFTDAGSFEYAAYRILQEGVRRGMVAVDVRPSAIVPRLCDGALTEDVA